MQLPPLTFTVLDTETTGFTPGVNRVIEFASVRTENGKLVDTYETLVQIPTEIPAHVTALTRIADDDVKDQSTFEDLRGEIEQHIGSDTLIVGQNVGFDIRMLRGENLDLTNRSWIDTSMLASLVYPELASYSLGYVSGQLDLNHEPVHRALGDVHATLELLSRCWERLLELPEDLLVPLRAIMAKAPEGYRQLFGALPAPTADSLPTWLVMPPAPPPVAADAAPLATALPSREAVALAEEPLDPNTLQQLINGMGADANHTTWVAVKNLHASLERLSLPDHVRVIQPPTHLLDHDATAALAAQDTYTADEATLALKLAWYEPQTRNELPIHGDEKAIWSGKLACTETSPAFAEQFADLPAVVLLNHWQLLALLADPDHPGHSALTEDSHVIIDDASMLEDTATKAYGWSCAVDALRAAAEGQSDLTRLVDLLQLWAERTRQQNDVHYLVAADLKTPEARSLREQIDDTMAGEHPAQLQQRLRDVRNILEADNLPGRIAFIDTRQDGSQYIESVPARIGDRLAEHLYARCATTLLVPPGSTESLPEILPEQAQTTVSGEYTSTSRLPLHLEADTGAADVLRNPPEGKTVLLMGSRGRIEDAFVRFAVAMEEQGITYICQNLSGGMGRMQAEFAAAEGSAVWVVTPWTFESITLPAGCIDHLIIDTLPFDHPAHTILSKRAEHYRNAFAEYSLPRLLHRLYRILRTCTKYRSAEADVTFLDERLEKKDYGRQVWAYLTRITGNDEDAEEAEDAKDSEESSPQQAKSVTDSSKPVPPRDDQLSMF